MAKEDKSATAALAKIEAGESISAKEMGSMLGALKANEENEITADYLKIEPGESVRVFFLEMTEIKSIADNAKEGDMSPAEDW